MTADEVAMMVARRMYDAGHYTRVRPRRRGACEVHVEEKWNHLDIVTDTKFRWYSWICRDDESPAQIIEQAIAAFARPV